MTATTITPTVANYIMTTISDISSTVTNTHSCFCDTVSTICTSVGLTPEPMESIWSVYPNPCSNLINIVSSSVEATDLSIYDINAKKIFQKSFMGNINISMEAFSSGLYFYEFKNKSGVVSKGKLMKN
ncbi:MAG: T9SS type A sorting domain-containing protein [Bacteroidetes bacterium]|nr:T9SS type A sorting domain-containing protein [Bacteroidota bacterium]